MIRKIFQALGEALRAIRANLLRTLLSILGIVIGVAALVIILSLIDGMEKYALDQISSTTSLESILLDVERYETVDGVRMKKEDLRTITYTDYLDLSKEISSESKAYMIYRENGKIYAGDSSVGGIARFVNQHEGLDFEVLEGQIPESSSFVQNSFVCGVSETLVESLFPNQELKEALGKSIRFDSITFTIEAVYKSNEKNKATFFYTVPNFAKRISKIAYSNLYDTGGQCRRCYRH